jgi:hypothetical protein
MKTRILLASLGLTLVAGFSGCGSSSADAPLFTEGDKAYTKCGMFFEGGVHRTTNYQKGVFIPVNTEVVLGDYNSNSIVFTSSAGVRLKIENVEDFSGEKITGIYGRAFDKSKTDLSKFTKTECEHIAGGEVDVGMSKAAVIVAIGYAPKHKTPSLSSNAWRYWRNRFNTFIVRFNDDKVTKIED